MKCLVPYLTVKDVEKSIHFYQNAFGFELCHIGRDRSENNIHVEMKCDSSKLLFAPEGACDDPSQSPLSLKVICPMGIYAYCDNVDERYHRAIQQRSVAALLVCSDVYVSVLTYVVGCISQRLAVVTSCDIP